jgi:hypothetical protein
MSWLGGILLVKEVHDGGTLGSRRKRRLWAVMGAVGSGEEERKDVRKVFSIYCTIVYL